MSTLSLSLNSSLATAGISNASPSQLTTISETVKSNQRNAGKSSDPAKADSKEAAAKAKPVEDKLSPEELRRIAELKRIDAEVRAHEQAHITVGRGIITSGPDYTYTYGPDSMRYAVAGEVGIDTSPEQKPQANIDKGQLIQAAALAPTNPSPQDFQVAATGKQLEQQGRSDLSAEQQALAEQAAEARQEDARLRAYETPGNTEGTQLNLYV